MQICYYLIKWSRVNFRVTECTILSFDNSLFYPKNKDNKIISYKSNKHKINISYRSFHQGTLTELRTLRIDFYLWKHKVQWIEWTWRNEPNNYIIIYIIRSCNSSRLLVLNMNIQEVDGAWVSWDERCSASAISCSCSLVLRERFSRAHCGSSDSGRKFVSVPVVPIINRFFFRSILHCKYNTFYIYILLSLLDCSVLTQWMID